MYNCSKDIPFNHLDFPLSDFEIQLSTELSKDAFLIFVSKQDIAHKTNVIK